MKTPPFSKYHIKKVMAIVYILVVYIIFRYATIKENLGGIS